MTLFLRTKDNRTIVDIELSKSKDVIDIRVATDLYYYSEILLGATDTAKQAEIVSDFSDIDNLRGWLWEVWEYLSDKPDEMFSELLNELRKRLGGYADKYELFYVED